MHLAIQHHTRYRYTAPVHYSIQQLRLTPRAETHQRARHWRVHGPGHLVPARDAYGNAVHTLALTEPHGDVVIEAQGEVEIDPLREGRLDERDGLHPLSFAVPTDLTAADDRVRQFADRALPRADLHGLMDLALAVFEAVLYAPGTTSVGSTAAQALELGRGVCQDHAHVFIAACRARALPARYVSGYYWSPTASHMASHAWADAWLPTEGWISMDITHRGYASDRLCRIAVGRDYASAAPVRGVRVGGGDESMQVKVHVGPGGADAMNPQEAERE